MYNLLKVITIIVFSAQAAISGSYGDPEIDLTSEKSSSGSGSYQKNLINKKSPDLSGATKKVVRPDATGYFPGDYRAIMDRPGMPGYTGFSFEGNPSFTPTTVLSDDSKYTPSSKYSGSKYTTVSKVSEEAKRNAIGVVHRKDYPENMTCYIISLKTPVIGYKYVCEYD